MSSPWVLGSCLIVILTVWWAGTRDRDFLTPPARIVELASPEPPQQPDVSPAVPQPPVLIRPAMPLGDLSVAPALHEYRDLRSKGAAYLIRLAGVLERERENARALLAWERVLDSTRSTPVETREALAAIRRLRPTVPNWNSNPSKAIPVMLVGSSGKKQSKALTRAMATAAKSLENASSGILRVSSEVTTVKDPKKKLGPSTMAIQFRGPLVDSPSSPILTATMVSADLLEDQVLRASFQLIVQVLAQTTTHTPPPVPADVQAPTDVLTYHLTRLCWHDVGAILNQPAKNPPAEPAKKPVELTKKKPSESVKKKPRGSAKKAAESLRN